MSNTKFANFLINLFEVFIQVLAGGCVLLLLLGGIAGFVLLLKNWAIPTFIFVTVSYFIGKELI